MISSRERVLCALDHKEPDKIPVDLCSTESSGITWKAYDGLKEKLGISGNTEIFDLMQLIVKPQDELLDIIGSDAQALLIEPREWKPIELEKGRKVYIPAGANIKENENGELILYSNNGIGISKRPKKGLYFDSIHHPLEKVSTTKDIDDRLDILKSTDLPYYMDEDFENLRKRAKKIYKSGRAVVANLWVHLLAAGQDLFGYEEFMLRLVTDKSLIHHFFNSQVEAYLPRIDDYIDAVKEYIDVIQVNDDLGTQDGLMISKDLYREMIGPYHKKLWGYIKEKSSKHLLLHSCGSVYDLIPDLIDMGIDALNPVQVSAKDMDTKKLKEEFGDHITFWGGGCDTQQILPNGTTDQVKEEVKKRVGDLSGGGGFIFCQVHNIQPDVPTENILAMYEALLEI